MRPKLFFIFRALTTVLVALVVLALSAVLISFILFSLARTGEAFLLGFGGRGILLFFMLFPWPLLALDLALLFLLDYLLRGWSSVYKFSVLSIFIALGAISFLLALVINATPFHHDLEMHAHRGELPVAGPFYEGARHPPHNLGVYRGIISSVGTSSFVMVHDDLDSDSTDSGLTVYLVGMEQVPFSKGDHVFVLGDQTSSTSIRAVNIHAFPAGN